MPKVNLKFLKFLKNLIIFSSLIYFVFFISDNFEQFLKLRYFGLINIFVIVILKILSFIFLSNMNLFTLKIINISLTKLESFNITIKNALGNLALPLKLGSGYKFTYLKNKFNFRNSQFIYLWTFISVLSIFPNGIIFISYLLYDSKIKFTEFLLSIFLVLALMFFLVYITKNLTLLKKFGSIHTFKYFSEFNIKVQIYYFFYFLIDSIVIFLIIRNIDSKYNFISAITFSFISLIISLLNLTPGNIGIKEGTIIMLNSIHGINFEIVIIVSIIDRILSFITLFVLEYYLKFSTKTDY